MRFLAALAVFMHLSWPFVGQLRAAPGEAVQVICTTHGAMTVPLDRTPQPQAAKPVCALCAAAGVAMTGVATLSIDGAAAPFAAPEAAIAAATQRLSYSPSRPRAPPAVS